MQGITKFRNTFPQLPWSIIQNPTFVQTAHGYVFVLHFCGSLAFTHPEQQPPPHEWLVGICTQDRKLRLAYYWKDGR